MGKDLKGKELGKGYSQRKDGRYEARAMINGVKINLYNLSLSKLKKEFDTEKEKVLRDEKGIRPASTTLSKWFEEWFQNNKSPQLKNDTSRKAYYRKISNTFIRLLGEKRVTEISQMNIQEAANELIEQGYTERSVKEGVNILKECLDIAILNHLRTTNPVQSINIKSSNELGKERRVLTHEEQKIFLEEVKDTYYYEPYCILLLTGLRIGEFSGLQWNDIDWQNKCIRVSRSMSVSYQDGVKIMELTTPKTFNAYREIPFFGETESLLKSWKERQTGYKIKLGDRWRCEERFGDLVFTTRMGSPVTRYVLAHDLKKVEENINLKEYMAAYAEGREPNKFEHIYPHAFRHTFATRCFEKGIDPLVVQSMMGHSNYSTTISYTHVLKTKMNEEASKVGNFLEFA